MLRLHSIETFGTHDGPGIRLVLFAQGCALRCVYCHNPDTLAMITKESKEYQTSDILELLEKQRPYFKSNGGLTVSGGEPTLQADALVELFSQAKDRGFHLALDTNGIIYSPKVKELYNLTDLVILDVKHIDEKWHQKTTGGSNVNVLKNAQYREETGKDLWLRYVLVPGWTDQPEFIEKWAKTFANYSSLKRVEILPYHTLGVHKYKAMGIPYALEGVEPPDNENVNRAQQIMEQYLSNVVIG